MKLALCTLLASACALGACQSAEPEEEPPAVLGDTVVDPLILGADLLAFTDEASAAIAGTAGDIAGETQDSTIRERTLTWKIRTIPLLRTTATAPDSRWGFLKLWVLVYISHESLGNGPTRDDFGEWQPRVVETMGDLKARLRDIGVRHFGEDVIAEAEADLEEYVDTALTGKTVEDTNLVVQGVTAVGGGMRSILSLPLKPFTGIDNTAEAIREAAKVAEGFHRTLDMMPDILRWQTELLLLNLGAVPAVESTLASAASISASAERLSTTAETLPEDIRRELDLAQPELRATLGEVRATLADVDGTLESVRTTLGTADGTVAEVTGTARALEDAANAVLPVVQTIEALATPAEDAPPPDPDARPFDITEYTETARALEAAAARIDSVVARLESDAMQRTMTTATEEAGVLVDRVTQRLLIVVAAVVAGAILYRLAARRIARGS